MADNALYRLRAAQGVIGLGGKHDTARLEAACARAIEAGDPSYKTIRGILAAGTETWPPAAPAPAASAGAFLRGPGGIFANVLPFPATAPGRRRGPGRHALRAPRGPRAPGHPGTTRPSLARQGGAGRSRPGPPGACPPPKENPADDRHHRHQRPQRCPAHPQALRHARHAGGAGSPRPAPGTPATWNSSWSCAKTRSAAVPAPPSAAACTGPASMSRPPSRASTSPPAPASPPPPSATSPPCAGCPPANQSSCPAQSASARPSSPAPSATRPSTPATKSASPRPATSRALRRAWFLRWRTGAPAGAQGCATARPCACAAQHTSRPRAGRTLPVSTAKLRSPAGGQVKVPHPWGWLVLVRGGSSFGSGFAHAVGVAVGGHLRNAKLQLSAVLAPGDEVPGLYLHPDHRRRLRRAPVRSDLSV